MRPTVLANQMPADTVQFQGDKIEVMSSFDSSLMINPHHKKW